MSDALELEREAEPDPALDKRPARLVELALRWDASTYDERVLATRRAWAILRELEDFGFVVREGRADS